MNACLRLAAYLSPGEISVSGIAGSSSTGLTGLETAAAPTITPAVAASTQAARRITSDRHTAINTGLVSTTDDTCTVCCQMS